MKEEEKETVDAINKNDVENKEGSDPEMKEAWNIQERKSKINHIPRLMVIGKFHFSSEFVLKDFMFLREESAAIIGPCCVRHISWDRFNVLLRLVICSLINVYIYANPSDQNLCLSIWSNTNKYI